jgi:5-methylcytosine-specific restriction endonuclease McrA
MFSKVDLSKKSVLILNKNWIPINVTTIKHSLSLLYSDNAKGLLVQNEQMSPLEWNQWSTLPVSEKDQFISTSGGRIKVPTIIILNWYDKIPRQKIKFTQKNLWERDNFTCQYTGKKLTKTTGTIDHIIPKSRGGKTSWENCVLAHKEINSLKADKTLDQIGLKLLKNPVAPRLMPVSFYIRNRHNVKEWNMFLQNM